jgi:predicted transcriptional regulator
MKPPAANLTRRERQIMDAIYRLGEATAAQVRAALPDPPSYSAVRALLRILEEKGHLRHRQEGIRYVFVPIKTRHHAGRATLRNVVRTFFGGSIEHAVAALLSSADAKLSKEESKRLAALITQARKEEER